MLLNNKQYVLLATAGQEYGIQNKSKNKNQTLLIVASPEDTEPTYDETTNADAFEIKIDGTLSSAGLPGPIWGAPLNDSVEFAIQTW